jgi:hypothetical protein
LSAITPGITHLNQDERNSLTRGEFWIPEPRRHVYQEALETLNHAGVRCVVSGMYAIYAYTGICRETKDLDLLMEPSQVVPAAEALKGAGFEVRLVDEHWLAKGLKGGQIVDLIFAMSNGIGFVDRAWHEHSRSAVFLDTPVRVAPPEELIWHRLFIGERHRFDMADVVHLILCRGDALDWDRLMERVGDDWRLLASQLHFFDFVYPGFRSRVPDRIRRTLRERMDAAEAEALSDADTSSPVSSSPLCRGAMLSRLSFAVDVNEWGFRDERAEHVVALRSTPVVAEIREASVWRE